MQIEVSEQTVESITRHLVAAGVASGDKVGNVETLLEMLARSPNSATFHQIVQLLKARPHEQDAPHEENALEFAERLGLVGTFQGPADLSTNPDHMNGFGQ